MYLRRNSHFFPPVLRACAVGAALLCAAPVQADDDEGPAWTFGGFATVGVVHADTRQADFTTSVLKAHGAGYTDRWSPDVDSRLGAQLGYRLDKQWSAVLQVVTEQRMDGSYRPQVEWANIKYQVTPDLSLRVGRIALPIFLAADYRKVGYAYPAVRTPVEVYSAVPISNSDGADLSYRWQAAGVKYVTQAFLGRTELKLLEDNLVKGRKLAGISTTAERGALSGRASVFRGEMTINIGDELFGGLRQFGGPALKLVDKYEIDHKRFDALTLGATYDPGNWFVTGELGRFDAHSFLGKTATRYASAGWRIAEWTPYLAYAGVRAESPTSDPGLPTAGLPPPYAAAARALNAGLDELLKTIPDQSTVSAGVRWDLRADMALKLQYDRVTPHHGSRGTLKSIQPGFRSDSGVNVTSVSLDVVF